MSSWRCGATRGAMRARPLAPASCRSACRSRSRRLSKSCPAVRRRDETRPQEGVMHQYMLLIYPPVDTPPPGRLSRWQEFTDGLTEAGALLANGRLQHVDSATTVRTRGGETLISDGPFAETKEYLAGFYLIECPDLDAALAHAARMPLEDYGTVEVRPMMFPAGTPAAEMDVPARA